MRCQGRYMEESPRPIAAFVEAVHSIGHYDPSLCGSPTVGGMVAHLFDLKEVRAQPYNGMR